MFTTLVITLPSEHQGGSFCITNNETSNLFDSGPVSAFDVSYVAWFNDVFYRFEQVTLGGRLTLTHHLDHDTLGLDMLKANGNTSEAKLEMLFSYWQRNAEEETSFLPSLLQKKYHYGSNGVVSYDSLGKNRQVVQYLQNAGHKYGLCIYLADLKRTMVLGTKMIIARERSIRNRPMESSHKLWTYEGQS